MLHREIHCWTRANRAADTAIIIPKQKKQKTKKPLVTIRSAASAISTYSQNYILGPKPLHVHQPFPHSLDVHITALLRRLALRVSVPAIVVRGHAAVPASRQFADKRAVIAVERLRVAMAVQDDTGGVWTACAREVSV